MKHTLRHHVRGRPKAKSGTDIGGCGLGLPSKPKVILEELEEFVATAKSNKKKKNSTAD